MHLKKSLVILGIFLYGLVGFASAQTSQPVFSAPVFQPVLADGGEEIKEALADEEDGIFYKALDVLRSMVIFFLGLYGIYLGVSIAFGQSEPGNVAAFFIGAMMALGAQAVSGLYTVLFEKSSGG